MIIRLDLRDSLKDEDNSPSSSSTPANPPSPPLVNTTSSSSSSLFINGSSTTTPTPAIVPLRTSTNSATSNVLTTVKPTTASSSSINVVGNPSSAAVPTAGSPGCGDGEATVSSTCNLRSCDDSSLPQSPPAKQKTVVSSYETDCSPPDDVGAFFGHPLTRATNALNGEDVDTNACGVALLHEYIKLPAIHADDLKVGDKLNGFLDIISGQRSDPTLSTADTDSSPSPTPSSLDHTSSEHSPDGSGDDTHHHNHHHTANDGVLLDNGVVVENGSSVTHGDVIAIPEYVNIFLQEDFRLDRYLIDGQGDVHTDPPDNNNNSVGNSSSSVGTSLNSIVVGGGDTGSGDCLIHLTQPKQQQQHPPETVVVNVTEEVAAAATRPRALKRSKSQKEPKRVTAQKGSARGRNARVNSAELVVTSAAVTSAPAQSQTVTLTNNNKVTAGGNNWAVVKPQQQVVTTRPVSNSTGTPGLVYRQSPHNVIHGEAELGAGLVVLSSDRPATSLHSLHPGQQHLHPATTLHRAQHQHQQLQQQVQPNFTSIQTPQSIHQSQLSPAKGVSNSLVTNNGLTAPLTNPLPTISINNKTASPARPALVVSKGSSGIHINSPVSSSGVQLQHNQQHQQQQHQHQHVLQRRHTVPLSQLQSLQQNNQHQQAQVLTFAGSNTDNNSIVTNQNIISSSNIISASVNNSNTSVSNNNNSIIVSVGNSAALNRQYQTVNFEPPQQGLSTIPSPLVQRRVSSVIPTPTQGQASYESLVKENNLLKQALSDKYLKQALSEKIRSRQQQQVQHLLHVEESTLSPSPSSVASSTPSTPTPQSPRLAQGASGTELILSTSSILSPSSSSVTTSSSTSSPPQSNPSPASAPVMPASHTLQFLTDEISSMGALSQSVKQECGDLYVLDSSFDHQYATYGSDLAHTVASLTNVCAGIPNMANTSDMQVTMAACDDVRVMNQAHHHPHHHHQQQQHPDTQGDGYNILSNNVHPHHHNHHLQSHHTNHHLQMQQPTTQQQDAMIVQSSGGQYFQVLQPLQSLDNNHSQQQHHNNMQLSTNNSNTPNNANNGSYYNYAYPQDANAALLETDKQVVVERYLHQQHQYAYNNNTNNSSSNNGYAHFLGNENTNSTSNSNYNMKSPDSGFQEPCLSPNSTANMVTKDISGVFSVEVVKDKPKKKKPVSSQGMVVPGSGSEAPLLMRQCSSSSTDKTSPKSPTVQKLEVNTTGYSYYLETPISTTQRLCEDRVTYLNKSQYYGLTLDFNSQDRVVKCAVVKSVIVLTFREEKSMEDERKAWEFWHGRQHSYKQRILDIDTKNCQGVLPQNIEEISFNAVAVRWNPMEGPVRVNIAVHCLSTDFSNQKGVKGIPLHVQIDTYEQSPKDNHLIHRGFCQIKAFCDKGAERKTRDEERRKAAKGKVDEFAPTVAQTTVKSKGRKKQEETAFHEPCDRSEFYSMADTVSPPVFFNPLHESSEFIHKTISLGVIPSQDEEISSLPTSIELPDSCDDIYNSSPPMKRARRDSTGNTKESQKVLLYVRERHETVYTALMLEVPSLHGLLRAVEQKYNISPSKVKNFYKKSRKGILVKMDDNIVRHFSHESTFILEMNTISDDRDYEIILIEIDPLVS